MKEVWDAGACGVKRSEFLELQSDTQRLFDRQQGQLNNLRMAISDLRDWLEKVQTQADAQHQTLRNLAEVPPTPAPEPKKPDIDQPLTLDIEGLAEIGAPVYHVSYAGNGVLVKTSGISRHYYVHWGDGLRRRNENSPLIAGDIWSPALALDLTNPIGQNILLRWVARKVGADPGVEAHWKVGTEFNHPYAPQPAGWRLYADDEKGGQVYLFHSEDGASPSCRKWLHLHYVPALANIADPIQALRIVALHLAGRL